MEICKKIIEFTDEALTQEDRDANTPLHFAVSWLGQTSRDFDDFDEKTGPVTESVKTRIEFLKDLILQPAGKHALHVVNEDNELPLHTALKIRAHPELLNKLLDTHLNAVSKDVNGDKALHLALRYTVDATIIVRLLDAYPDAVKEVDSLGNLPINYLVTSVVNQELLVSEENQDLRNEIHPTLAIPADRYNLIITMSAHFHHYVALLDVWRQGLGTPATLDDLSFVNKMGRLNNSRFERLVEMIIMTKSDTNLQANLTDIDREVMKAIKSTENPIRAALEYGRIIGSRAGKTAG